mgnify:CR=1 FL=1
MSIEIESLSYTYMEDTPLSHTALHDVTLTIREGAFTAIAGETGAGKSTLMQLIGGLLRPTAGAVRQPLRQEQGGERGCTHGALSRRHGIPISRASALRGDGL